jgi:ribonuclease Z
MSKQSKPAFATPLPQSARSEILEWKFPKPHHQLVLTGKSRAAWHTSFVIPHLNLLLDAGLVVNNARPKHIFITHGHSDHSLLAPAFVKREDPPDIYCPTEVKRALDDFILAKTMLNRGGHIDIEAAEQNGLKLPENPDEGRSRSEQAFLSTHVTHGLQPGDVVPLRRFPGVTATAFSCPHNVPCIGYLFSQTTNRLKAEYTGLSGPEIRDLRKTGVDITAPHTAPIFAFLGDTTAETLAAEPEWLREEIPVVITECSFLYEKHRDQAIKTKHTYFPDLLPTIRKWPKTTFILTRELMSPGGVTCAMSDLLQISACGIQTRRWLPFSKSSKIRRQTWSYGWTERRGRYTRR